MNEKQPIITDEIAYKYKHTHDWWYGDVWVCKTCGGSTISLGMWGDNHWRNVVRGWEYPCRGSESKDIGKAAREESERRKKKREALS